MNLSVVIGVGLFIASIAGILAWSIRYYTRVVGLLAAVLEAPRMSWGCWSDRSAEGLWKGLPVKVRATYALPVTLDVTVQRPADPPELDAYMSGSGKMEFRAIRSGLLMIHTIARVSEDQLLLLNGAPVDVDIASYFTPVRVRHLRTLLSDLGWRRFVKDREGLTVSVPGELSSRWTADQARNLFAKTLVELCALDA